MKNPEPAAKLEEHTLSALADTSGCLFHGGLKGIEKESLRVDSRGRLSDRAHPDALGSTLTHPEITTDYSEALLEFITPPRQTAAETLEYLNSIQRFVYKNIRDEILWATSMPCLLGKDSDIPIAEYGSSNVGTMKHVYRRGLGYRYGRKMQTIAGVHFNFSLPEKFWPVWRATFGSELDDKGLRSKSYFGLIRNFQRHGWIVPYLFGASPAACSSFLDGRLEGFEKFDEHTIFLPHATSLRMSDIGYKNKAQDSLKISYNDIDSYVQGLWDAIEEPWPEYSKIGVKVDGEYRQLNDHLLQIENEYYSFMRPKNVAESGEKPTLALKRRGVRYIEVRALDVNAFEPAGISLEQLHFLEVFLVYCMLAESPPIDDQERAEINFNQSLVAVRGREPELALKRNGRDVLLRDWADDILAKMRPVAALMDRCEPESPYTAALDRQLAVAADPDLTPSARMLAEMQERGESFFAFALRKSQEHHAAISEQALDAATEQRMQREARDSLAAQAEIEAADTLGFDEYLEHYFSQRLDD
ncbi:MAG: glutamate--cysteine ligase [Gammaproteobacteria bacterium]|nr:glutamate--cysteine ligase [Gammaproteobacteria bacterium]